MSPLPGFSSHFGVANLPFGIASSAQHPKPACVSRLHDSVIFLDTLSHLFDKLDLPENIFQHDTLNSYAAMPKSLQLGVRKALHNAIIDDPELRHFPEGAVEHISAVTMHMPVQVGDFTDFSCSSHHVHNASEAMTGKRSAPPAFFHLPVGYAGRCSSLEVSGTPVERPFGQFWNGKPGESEIVFRPSRKMDYELELGCIIGKPLPRRQKISAAQAYDHIFGYVLVNDWSARDIQALEMIPLGPLNGKNAATTLSPWIITSDALADFVAPLSSRLQPTSPYLAETEGVVLDVQLEVKVAGAGEHAPDGKIYCRSNTSAMYWTLGQCVAHQAIGGCGLRTGDLLATGTVSGASESERGCLLEHMRVGAEPPRGYIDDGETVMLSGFCADGVGFGECVATLMPAREVSFLA